ncbi:hypothetical protein ACFOWA_01045 [Pedobacter lithocola]|uniref:Uncharacterized protein n=1 Tax=Pedobacter lithocola TaxID=1908239 RepID=A0ABV8P3C2_9SPHI
MNRNRILEIILGAALVAATTAKHYGWINRAIPEAQIDAYVEVLAKQISTFSKGVIEATKSVLTV